VRLALSRNWIIIERWHATKYDCGWASRGFWHAGPSIWNSLPPHLRSTPPSNPISKLTCSVLQAFLAPNNSIHALLIHIYMLILAPKLVYITLQLFLETRRTSAAWMNESEVQRLLMSNFALPSIHCVRTQHRTLAISSTAMCVFIVGLSLVDICINYCNVDWCCPFETTVWTRQSTTDNKRQRLVLTTSVLTLKAMANERVRTSKAITLSARLTTGTDVVFVWRVWNRRLVVMVFQSSW